jgi:nitrite reductase/ring-hydroxylating ferredoxin subunit
MDRTADGWRFFCPCHKASFNADGARTDAVSESPRDMDALDVVVKNGEIEVKFQNFALGASQKVAKA